MLSERLGLKKLGQTLHNLFTLLPWFSFEPIINADFFAFITLMYRNNI